jgi:hypothetical protein
MSASSVYLINKILGHVFGKASYTPPSFIYLGLSSSDPLVDGTGIVEPSDGYARVTTTPSDWDTPSGGVLYNASVFTFPVATGAWTTVSYFFLSDSFSNGNLLFRGTLNTPISVDLGEKARFEIGTLEVPL